MVTAVYLLISSMKNCNLPRFLPAHGICVALHFCYSDGYKMVYNIILISSEITDFNVFSLNQRPEFMVSKSPLFLN